MEMKEGYSSALIIESAGRSGIAQFLSRARFYLTKQLILLALI